MDFKRVHFIGIGGIGISALARYFLSYGYKVSGSDLANSETIENLEKEGANIFIGHNSINIPRGTELVIYSPAVKRSNPELQTARKVKIKTLSYPQALGELTKKFYTIAVSGTHGKSTVTSLIALLLTKAGIDPTVIVGTNLKEFNGANFRKGEGKYLVIEADEWNRSFHNYYPKVIVLTNIDKDHLDTYHDFKGVVRGFEKYLERLKNDGILIANWKDKKIRKLANAIIKKRIKAKSQRTPRKPAPLAASRSGFGPEVVFYNQKRFKKHNLGIPGGHNQVNAEAAWAAAKILGVKKSLAEKVFKNYKGSWRRLEKLHATGCLSHASVFTDYAHHPTEIKVTLRALRDKYPKKQIICVFEPHQQNRLEKLFKDFIHAFDKADVVILMPVYKVAGRDEDGETDSFALAQKIKNHKSQVFYAQDFRSAIKAIRRYLTNKGVVVFMSAGDLDSQLREWIK